MVQGQQAENLLDFGDDDDEVATTGNNSAAAVGIGGLDELMGGASMSEAPGATNANSQKSQLNDLLGL